MMTNHRQAIHLFDTGQKANKQKKGRIERLKPNKHEFKQARKQVREVIGSIAKLGEQYGRNSLL